MRIAKGGERIQDGNDFRRRKVPSRFCQLQKRLCLFHSLGRSRFRFAVIGQEPWLSRKPAASPIRQKLVFQWIPQTREMPSPLVTSLDRKLE